MGSRFTKYDLEHVTDYIQFEFFCNDLMSRQGYKNIEPLGGHKDRGRDAIDVDTSTGQVTIFTYSVREDWNDKLDEDLAKIHKHAHPCNRIVFLTTASPTATEKDNKKVEVKTRYGWDLELYDLERIATLVDNQHQQLRDLHPDIFLFSSQLFKYERAGKDLNREEYAKYLLASHEEWLEKYTPLLAEHREIETYVARIDSGRANAQEIAVAAIPAANQVSLLLAESGAGKTTALWRIIVETCTTILEGKSEKLPILIGLRGWGLKHTCRQLVQDQFELLGVSREAVEQELRRGNCLILIDGLNEIPFGRTLRTEAYQDIARFLSIYQDNAFVITCRASDYESRMLDREKLSAKVRYPQAYEIRRMGRDQIIEYVRRYFTEAEQETADELLRKLGVFNDGVWEDKKSIVHLARIPLYLQLFISEYKRTRELPTSQAKLLQALIYITLERETGRQAAAVDTATKEGLLSSFAYQTLDRGYLLQLPETLAREIFSQQVQKLKDRSEISADLTVGAVWQEVISNNFLKFVERPWVEWLHQLIFDYFLAGQIVHIWTVGADTDRGGLRARLSRYVWVQPCGIALGLIDPKNGAAFLELLLQVDHVLAQRAFEAQSVEDQRELAGALIDDVIEQGDPDTERLKMLTVNLPSKPIVESLIDKFGACSVEMEVPIAEAISAMMIDHSPNVIQYREYGDIPYGGQAERIESLGAAVRRGTDILMAWTNDNNELVSFHAAKGLWELERGLATDTLRRLHGSGNGRVAQMVKDLMDEWGIE